MRTSQPTTQPIASRPTQTQDKCGTLVEKSMAPPYYLSQIVLQCIIFIIVLLSIIIFILQNGSLCTHVQVQGTPFSLQTTPTRITVTSTKCANMESLKSWLVQTELTLCTRTYPACREPVTTLTRQRPSATKWKLCQRPSRSPRHQDGQVTSRRA